MWAFRTTADCCFRPLYELTYLKEGNDLRYDGFNLTVQLLGINLRAAPISRRAFCHKQ